MTPDYDIQIVSGEVVDPETGDFEVLEECGRISVEVAPDEDIHPRTRAFARAHTKHHYKARYYEYQQRRIEGKKIKLRPRVRVVPVEEKIE